MPALGERFLDARRRLTSARQVVNRALRVCCVDPSRVPADVVDALVNLTADVDRRQTDAAYLQSARSITSLVVRPAAAARHLQRLDRPVLLIHGERDLLIRYLCCRRLHTAHPEWRLAVAGGVGHVPMLEAPAWTAAVIDEWLSGVGLPAVAPGRGASFEIRPSGMPDGRQESLTNPAKVRLPDQGGCRSGGRAAAGPWRLPDRAAAGPWRLPDHGGCRTSAAGLAAALLS